MRRSIRALALASALAMSMVSFTVAPSSAAIHEIVASFCSGGQGNVDPGGQVRFGSASFLRALQASGVYDVRFGELPDGTPDADAVTIHVDFDRPNSKFSGPGFFLSFPVPELGLTVYIELGDPDHPAFDHCPRFLG